MSHGLSEFRLHSKVTNPAHIIGFLSQWKMYLEQMPDREGGKYYKGKKLDITIIEKVRVSLSWTEWTTNIWLRCHRNNWASYMNSCNLQRRFGLLRHHELLIYDRVSIDIVSLAFCNGNQHMCPIPPFSWNRFTPLSNLRVPNLIMYEALCILYSAEDKVSLDTKNLHFMTFYFDRSLQEGRVEKVCWELKWITKPKRVKLRYNTKIRYHHPGGDNVHKRKTCPHDNLIHLPCLKPLWAGQQLVLW